MLDASLVVCDGRCKLRERLKPRTLIRISIVGTLFALTSFVIAISQHDSSLHGERSSTTGADKCGVWSLDNLLLHSSRTTLTHSTNGSIARTQWSHRRSGVYGALGIMHATVERCAQGGCAAYGGGRLSAASVLCRGGGSGSGVVLQIRDGTYDDLLPTAREGANLWHFHAAALRLWVALRLVDAARIDHRRKVAHNARLPLGHVRRPVVILLTMGAWRKLKLPTDVVVFRTVGDELQRLESQGAVGSALEAMQALGTILGGRVHVVREDATVGDMEGAQMMGGFPRGVAAWVTPPHDPFHMYPGLLWDVAHDNKLANQLSGCRKSLLQLYADDITAGAAREPARHVCVVSRQSRRRVGDDDTRGHLRNFEADFYARLIRRLAAPIILSPGLAIVDGGGGGDTNSNTNNERTPLVLGSTSITGQMRYVRRECAVLMGAHGAGLTNALGLQRGGALVELMPRGTSPPMQYFRNTAALLTDVTYDMVEMDAKGTRNDVNLTLDDRALDHIVQLVNTRLHQSVWHQRSWWIGASANAHPPGQTANGTAN